MLAAPFVLLLLLLLLILLLRCCTEACTSSSGSERQQQTFSDYLLSISRQTNPWNPTEILETLQPRPHLQMTLGSETRSVNVARKPLLALQLTRRRTAAATASKREASSTVSLCPRHTETEKRASTWTNISTRPRLEQQQGITAAGAAAAFAVEATGNP